MPKFPVFTHPFYLGWVFGPPPPPLENTGSVGDTFTRSSPTGFCRLSALSGRRKIAGDMGEGMIFTGVTNQRGVKTNQVLSPAPKYCEQPFPHRQTGPTKTPPPPKEIGHFRLKRESVFVGVKRGVLHAATFVPRERHY